MSNTPTPIPILDFSHFTHGSEAQKKDIARAIDDAFQSVGFVYLVNHGIPREKVGEAFEWSKKFFALPTATKMLAPHPPGGSHHRGYSSLGVEKVSQNVFDEEEIRKLRAIPDYKESFESGNVHDEMQPNIWLPEEALPGFREFMEGFFDTLASLTHTLLDALSLSLSLPSSLSPTHSQSLFQLRLLHYPFLPLSALSTNTLHRITPHSDFGTLTLLFQDSVGGLEIQDPNNETVFRKVEPVEDAVLVNVGDLLSRWSNGRWRSTVHRVVAPAAFTERGNAEDGDGNAEEIMLPERYSIPFFATADMDAVIEALPGTVDDEHPALFEKVTAWEYVQMRMKALYSSE